MGMNWYITARVEYIHLFYCNTDPVSLQSSNTIYLGLYFLWFQQKVQNCMYTRPIGVFLKWFDQYLWTVGSIFISSWRTLTMIYRNLGSFYRYAILTLSWWFGVVHIVYLLFNYLQTVRLTKAIIFGTKCVSFSLQLLFRTFCTPVST
jgi:hypothetical protein